MNIKDTLDALGQAAASPKDVDLSTLVRLHSLVDEVGVWAKSNSQLKVSRAAKAMAQILEKTVLQSGPDIQAALDVFYPTLEAFRQIYFEDKPIAEVRFPVALSMVAKRPVSAKDELEGTNTVFRPPKFINDTDGRIAGLVRHVREHLTNVDVQLLALESAPRDHDAIEIVSRAFGSIESGGAEFGLEELSEYARAAKNLVEGTLEEHGELTATANDGAFDAIENLRTLLANVDKALAQGCPVPREVMLPVWIEELKIALQSKPDLLQGVELQPDRASKKLGEILLESGVVSREGLDEALRIQSLGPEKKFVGDILVDEAKVSRTVLNNALEIQQQDPSLGKVGDILVEMGAVDQRDVASALKKQQAPEKPKLGEVLVRSGQASAKGVAQTVRKQNTLRDLIRYGMSTLAGLVSGGGEEPQPKKPRKQDDEKKYIEADAKLTADFIARTKDHLEAAEVHVIRLQSEPNDSDATAALYRAFHGIQRTSAFLGLDDIKLLSGEAEYVIDRVRKGRIDVTDGLIDITFDAIESLKQHVGFVESALQNDDAIETDPEFRKLIGHLRAAALGRVDHIQRKKGKAKGAPAAPKKLGELLLETGATTQEGLDAALKLQQEPAAPLKLGEILVEQAKISRTQLQEALRIQRDHPERGKLGDILVQLGYVDPEDIDPAILTQQTPRKMLLGEALVRSGGASARSVAQALRSQKAILALMRAGATAAVISGSFMYGVDANAATLGAGSAQVTISMEHQLDTDNDGLTDDVEASLGTETDNFDTDADGIDDSYEVFHGMDPKNADDAQEDFDGDGLSNLEEFQNSSSPHDRDTDADGFWDNVEVDRGTAPDDAGDSPNTGIKGDVNADGRVDAIDVQNVINAAVGNVTEVPGDVNQVGGVDALDVQQVINAALNDK